MVLGTCHLERDLKGSFNPSMLKHLLDQLEAFKPDVIAVEARSGEHLREFVLLPRTPEREKEFLASHAHILKLGQAAQAHLRLDAFQAAKATHEGGLKPARRALLHLAGYDLPNALLYWGASSAEERALVPSELALGIDKQLNRTTEIQSLALPLAKRLGHSEIACVDELEQEESAGPLVKAFMEDVSVHQLFANMKVFQTFKKELERAVRAGDLLSLYAYINSPAFTGANLREEWGQYLSSRFKNDSGRAVLAMAESRNFRIASRIRLLSAHHPGKRILVIYGASHKAFLDAYLGLCGDMRIVQPFARLPKGERKG